MNKPLSIIIQDAKDSIANAINETQLSPVLCEPILKDLYIEVQRLAREQIMQEKEQYEKALKEEADKNKNKQK